MKKINPIILTLLLGSLMVACSTNKHAELGDGIFAEFTTNQGTFIAKLYHEQTPLTVANFVSLAEGTNEMLTEEDKKGTPFYDGLIFHRVIKDFMIQGGDPEGNGSGGPGYRFPDEFVPELTHSGKGILSMANSGPNTNGSQFFITLKETPWLDGKHSAFGEIVEGQEVVDAIGVVETKNDRPVNDAVMEKVTIIRNGNPKLTSFEKQLKKIEKEHEKALAEKENIRKKNQQKFETLFDNSEELESGLRIHYVEKNDNEKPDYQDKAGINYAGYLTDGTLFDSNLYEVVKTSNPDQKIDKDNYKFNPLNVTIEPELGFIPGFKEAVLKMNYGEKVYILIPPHLAYGENGVPQVIPPNSELIFYIEVLKAE